MSDAERIDALERALVDLCIAVENSADALRRQHEDFSPNKQATVASMVNLRNAASAARAKVSAARLK